MRIIILESGKYWNNLVFSAFLYLKPVQGSEMWLGLEEF